MTGDPLAASTIRPGSKVGRFVVITELGSGGMGAVYAALDPQLDRQVALKVMRDATDNEEDRVRMLREGQAMARVTHPNVITVYEVGTESGGVFLAQELLDGGTLGKWLEQPHTREEILDKFIAAGRGLAAAHAAGLVHRDFKPDNVLLGKDGRVRVADFGLARALGAHDVVPTTRRGGGPPRDDAAVTQSPMSPLTRTGAVLGTPMFMAPEQHEGQRADARSDQFGFCVALYHALYKDWPFSGKTSVALADAVIEGRLAREPKGAHVPAPLRRALLRGLSTKPADRYPSMDALLADLALPPARRSRWPFVVGSVVLVGVLGAGGYAVYSARTAKPEPVVARPPQPSQPPELQALASEKGIAWLVAAIDRGQLDDAIEKYELAETTLLHDPAKAAIIEAASAFVHVARGDLKLAQAKLEQASEHAGKDPAADPYLDLAAASIAAARGELEDARDTSKRCAMRFQAPAPVMAAICYQVHGEMLAELGDAEAARAAFDSGLALAKRANSAERTSTLTLALAELDLDAQERERAATSAAAIQNECAERGARGCEVDARILLARAHLDAGASQQAIELLERVKPATTEMFRIRIAHAIALGEIHGYMNEAGDDEITGLQRIEQARIDAERQGFAGLVFEARLARSRVMLVHALDGAHIEHAALVREALARGFERIAHVAQAHLAELEDPPQGMLPADGGLPAVRP